MMILRSFLALFTGFLCMVAVVGVATAALMKFAPHWVGATGQPRVVYVIVNLAYSLAAAMAGGYVTAWIALGTPLKHVLVLAIIVLLLGGLSALQQRGLQPVWYQLLLMIIAPTGVLLGGLLRLRIMGLL